ncbi:Fanconi anemia group I protein [Pogonomyrmex barbatus]|uniref:Fanconi anemia group I protein n=1 Tax=Pogonomyrmex barbatus TaxID=144034 RepID=A0A6I9WX03_9HYME|nr:Fanconi anemia group I protein [Pogonomyrmex barbatus]
MSAKLNSLLSQKDRAQLREFVQKTSTEELTKIISNGIVNADNKILDGILQVCSESESLYAKRLKLVKSALKTLGQAKISISHANDIVNRIVIDFPEYPKLHLVQLVNFCLDSIRDNDDEFRSWKDLLPVLLEILEEEKYINHMNSEVSGSKYKSIIINNICNSKWETEIMPSLAGMFRDISLEKEDHSTVITVLCTKLQDISLEEVPPFVHQSLRLCTNQNNKYLLEALKRYFTLRFSQANSDTDTFETIDVVNPKEIQDVESTVLYHISQAAELNHQHVRDYIKYFKSLSHIPEVVLEPFMLSVLLTVASVDENQIYKMLREIINNRNENDNKQKNSAWLKKLIPDSCSVMTVMENVINASNKDRHLVLKGLVDLAFVLMAVENKTKTGTHPLWQIGTKILQKIMRKHHEAVATIFQMLIDKITAGGSCISQYTDCLAYMCRKLTVLILDHQDSIIMLFDQISFIPGEIAIFIVSAIFPLVQVSVSIREHIILTLRKTLYRKGTFNRQMAVSGILEMLRNLKMHSMSGLAMSSSQCANSSLTGTSSTSILTQVILERGTQSGSTSRYNRSLCYDILGILRRCFTHECEVRLHLYNDLYEAVLKNMKIAEYVLEMLLPHFKTFFEADENVAVPIKLDLCTTIQGEQVISQEPLAELVLILQKIYIKSALIKSSVIDELAVILESLCKRMSQLETEHLNLEDKLDLNNSNIKVQEKLQSVLLTIKIYEALISFRIGAWSINCTDTAQSIKNLFKGYARFVEFTKRAPRAKKGEGKNKKAQNDTNTTIKKAGRSGSIKLPPSIMDLPIIYKSLMLFYVKSVPWATADQVAMLIDYHEFYLYILRILLQILQNIKLLTEYNLRKHKEQYMKTYFEIGKLLYDYVILDFKNILNTDEQGTILALECFKELCCLICTYFSSEISHFLNFIIPNESTQTEKLNMQLENIIAILYTSFNEFFNEKEEHEENSKQILCILLDIIYQLTREINFYETNGDKVFDLMMKFTQLENMHPQASLTIFQILLWIEQRSKEYGELLIDITFALCEKMGSIDKAEISLNSKFKIIHEDTADKLYNLINNSIKEKLDHVSWLLERLKAEHNIACLPGTDLEKHQEKVRTQERSLCKQLSHIIQILYTLANVAIQPGLSTEIMFKNLQVLYNLLSSLTRYFHGRSSKQNAAFQSVKFIQVIQSAGKPLKSAFYNLITHTEEAQNASKSKVDTHVRRNKILRETKTIPRVIYEIEQFHNEILSLDKKTGVPLETYIKHSITRDFRIKNSQLTEALEKMNISLLDTQTSHRSNNISNADINDVSMESTEIQSSNTSLKRPRKNDSSLNSSMESSSQKRPRRSSES